MLLGFELCDVHPQLVLFAQSGPSRHCGIFLGGGLLFDGDIWGLFFWGGAIFGWCYLAMCNLGIFWGVVIWFVGLVSVLKVSFFLLFSFFCTKKNGAK